MAGDFSDGITDGLKNREPYARWDLFTVNNTDGITDRFEMSDLYQ